MALVFVARNITQAFTLARSLRACGETPVVFACGEDVPMTVHDIPAVSVAVPRRMTRAARNALRYEIDTYARRSHPSMVIADRETADICADAGEARVLLVDAEFKMRHPLRHRRYARAYTRVLVSGAGKKSAHDIAQSLHAIARTHSLPAPDAAVAGPPRAIGARNTGNSSNRLLIRFDDVTELEDVVVAIIRLCLEQGLCLSLDVIPYLCRFDGDDLRSLEASPDRVEVAQHGYAHLGRVADTGERTEFVRARDALALLRRGKARMISRFPDHFHGGYSAPYDFVAPGLAKIWRELGGRYLSAMRKPEQRFPLPHVRLTTDPWDWVRQRPRPSNEVIASLDRAAIEQGVAGLVLHPAPLRASGELERICEILRIVARRGFTPALVSAACSSTSERTSTS